MSLNEKAYQHGREHAEDYGVPSEDIAEWLSNDEIDQDGMTAWFARGVLEQRSGLTILDDGTVVSY